MEVSMAELGDLKKSYIKLRFKVDRIEGHKAFTQFGGLELTKDNLYRLMRKRLQKVETIFDVTTKDQWVLQLTALTILNRTAYTEIQRRVRNNVRSFLTAAATQATLDDFVHAIIDGVPQMQIRKQESKLYPVRFSEIAKIEVRKVPAG